MRLYKLKYWRQKLNVKQKEMALLLGCTISNYSCKENGKIITSLDEAIIILELFNKKLRKLQQPKITLDDIFLE